MSQKQILIVTPHSDFGDIVSQSLGKEASCEVNVATTISEAFTQIKKSKSLNYALLDMELGVEKVLEQGFTLRNTFPLISLILISKKYPPAEMEDLRPWEFLRKPFIQRELLDLIRDGNVTIDQDSEFNDLNLGGGAGDTVHPWFNDEVRATKNLVAAISNLNVQEAFLVSKTDILAHSGELPTEAVEECSKLVRKYWEENSTAELIKPVRLETTRKEHLLSATVLAVGIILALTFDAETPFDIMRSQTRHLTNVLKNPRLSLPDVLILPNNAEIQAAKRPVPSASLEFISTDIDKSQPASGDSIPDLQGNKLGRYQEGIAFRQESTGLSAYMNPDFGEDKTTQSVPTTREHMAERESPMAWTDPTQPEARNQYEQSSFWIRENQHVETESRMNATGELTHSSLSPTDPSLFDVYYACLLVPRIRTHVLDGDCASYLRGELPNVFLAYGWRLEELIIDHSYLQWLVRIPPTIAPAAHIKVIRRQSSQMILTNFARFNRNEFLRDFWSPGYLLGGGRHLIPAAEIAEFIRINRKQYYSEENPLWEPKRETLDYR
ncbi:MAG: transposase [Chloroflexi bacterium]|nr:transposase [Chloroflexota bacterium]